MERLNYYLDKISRPFEPLAFWLLRLGLGIAFILHGLKKFPLPPEKMAQWFTKMGYAYPEFITSSVAVGELMAGVGVILGGLFRGHIGNLITRLSGGIVIVIMTGAFTIAHSDWFFTEKLFTSEQIFLFILGIYFAIRGNRAWT